MSGTKSALLLKIYNSSSSSSRYLLLPRILKLPFSEGSPLRAFEDRYFTSIVKTANAQMRYRAFIKLK